MSVDRDAATSLSGLLDRVDGEMETLTIYNYEGPSTLIEDVYDYFGQRLVMVREATTGSGVPTGMAVLHDDEEFVAADDIETIHEAITATDRPVLEDPAFECHEYPDVCKALTTTGFTYEKPRMVLASHEIERRAWRARSGELRAGFQQLSHVRDQWELYAEIAAQDVDVHVYGAPDWKLPSAASISVHRSEDEEIRRSWFVAFDSADGEKAALLSEERDSGVYQGFWTFDPSLVDTLFSYLRENRSASPAD